MRKVHTHCPEAVLAAVCYTAAAEELHIRAGEEVCAGIRFRTVVEVEVPRSHRHTGELVVVCHIRIAELEGHIAVEDSRCSLLAAEAAGRPGDCCGSLGLGSKTFLVG